MRSATIERNTLETQIKVSLNLDGQGLGTIDTGVPFFDHMLDQIKRHACFDLTVHAIQ
jgi:imidazoleglycerol-phosphate dehydratase